MLLVATSPPPPGVVRAAADLLRRGEVVALPTDTVYGIAALPTLPAATDRLFELKKRARDMPVAVLCAHAQQALSLVDQPSEQVRRIAEALWPGPLTLVLPRRPDLGFHLGDPPDTIGLRCPDHDLIQALAREVGPIATTSANLHGAPTPTSAPAVAKLFDDEVALVIDGGPCRVVPSTVVDAAGSSWHLLREGPIALQQVQTAAAPSVE